MHSDTSDPRQTLRSLAWQLQSWDLGLEGMAYTHPDHLTPTIEVDTEGLMPDLLANGSQTLGELRSKQPILRQTLLIEPL